MPQPTLICSLCREEIPAAYLRQHYEREKKEIEAYAMELIKQAHPEWSETDPTCQKCWKHYQEIAAT